MVSSLWCNVLLEQNNEDPITMEKIKSPVVIKHDFDVNNMVVYDKSTLYHIINLAVIHTVNKLADFGFYDEEKGKYRIQADDHPSPKFMSYDKVLEIAYGLPLGKSPFTRKKFSLQDIISLKDLKLLSVT